VTSQEIDRCALL